MPICVLLPGIIAPAVVRYAPLRAALGADVTTRTRELELYNYSPPPAGYGIEVEVDALRRCVEREASPVHLYGHSGGGAVALAFVATYPELVLSLAVDEPAFDFTPEARTEFEAYWPLMSTLISEPNDAMKRFLALELKAGVEFSPPIGAPAPLPNRPEGIATLLGAFRTASVDPEAYRRFAGPVLLSYGTLSNQRYAKSAQRLANLFPRYRAEAFEGRHHLNTSHQAEPQRVAQLLQGLWAEAETKGLAQA